MKLTKNWRTYLWVLGGLGLLAAGCILWQLPFPSNVLVVGMAWKLGDTMLRVETLNRWRETELQIEQEQAERLREERGPVHH